MIEERPRTNLSRGRCRSPPKSGSWSPFQKLTQISLTRASRAFADCAEDLDPSALNDWNQEKRELHERRRRAPWIGIVWVSQLVSAESAIASAKRPRLRNLRLPLDSETKLGDGSHCDVHRERAMPNNTLQNQPSRRPEFAAGNNIPRHAARSSGKVSSSPLDAKHPRRLRTRFVHATRRA